MYLTKNIYDRYATFFNLPDKDAFLALHEQALDLYAEKQDEFAEMTDEEISALKTSSCPVIFATTVSKYNESVDKMLKRSDMNDRARRRYIILDVDFDAGQEDLAEIMRNKLLDLASTYQTNYLLYPTASYPSKPRFRFVLFAKSLMNERSYYQAVTWVYSQIGLPAFDQNELSKIGLESIYDEQTLALLGSLDASNKKIKSNNNAPMYVNEAQIEYVSHNLNDNLDPLDNAMWKHIDAPKPKKKPTNSPKGQYDELPMTDEFIEIAATEYGKSSAAQNYETFWPMMHSIARAEYHGQITSEQVDTILNLIAHSDNPYQQAYWKLQNPQLYKTERSRVFESEEYLANARPLMTQPGFFDAYKEGRLFG